MGCNNIRLFEGCGSLKEQHKIQVLEIMAIDSGDPGILDPVKSSHSWVNLIQEFTHFFAKENFDP